MAEQLNSLVLEQYGIKKTKAMDIQSLNMRLFYDFPRLKWVPATSTFSDIFSNYHLVVHNIASIILQHANIHKEPIRCTFATLQNMEHSVRIAYVESESTYRGDKWSIHLKPLSQGLVQVNGTDPSIWDIFSTPLPN